MVKLDKIRGLMAEHRDTQESLANKLGVSKQLVNLKLLGKSPFSIEQLAKVAHLYGVTTQELIED